MNIEHYPTSYLLPPTSLSLPKLFIIKQFPLHLFHLHNVARLAFGGRGIKEFEEIFRPGEAEPLRLGCTGLLLQVIGCAGPMRPRKFRTAALPSRLTSVPVPFGISTTS